MYEALSYQCMRPSATTVCGLNLLVYAANQEAQDAKLREENRRVGGAPVKEVIRY